RSRSPGAFEREAQVLASLNHPNIVQIHGVDESSSTPALIMELVEGPTLADRIAQGAILVEEALPFARQIHFECCRAFVWLSVTLVACRCHVDQGCHRFPKQV